MLRLGIVCVGLIAAIILTGCTTADPGSSKQHPSADRSDAVEPAPATEPATETRPEADPYVPDPKGFGDACSDDAGCGWDDPCMPSRCIGSAHVPEFVGCDKSLPPPGTCSCVEGHCSLRPNAIASAGPSCRTQPCGLDQGAGRCVVGSQLEANRAMRELGPACHCDPDQLECRFVWVEPIACDDVEQCWVSDSPPHHPIARPEPLRGHKFEPCRDGPVVPVCKNGRCSLTAFRC